MAKMMTRKNAALVLARLAVFISEDDDNGAQMADELNDWLDTVADQDVFGTEGQNDPRGDARG